MPERNSFEYAIIRIVPKVEREEFLNVGVVLYCKKFDFLQAMISLDMERLKVFCPTIDISEVNSYLQAIHRICAALPEGGPIGKLDTGSRFRWLTAARSTVVQTSKVHSGLCIDPLQMLSQLHAALVM